MFGYRSPVDDLALEACCKDILFNPVECDLRTAFAADVDFRAAGQSFSNTKRPEYLVSPSRVITIFDFFVPLKQSFCSVK